MNPGFLQTHCAHSREAGQARGPEAHLLLSTLEAWGVGGVQGQVCGHLGKQVPAYGRVFWGPLTPSAPASGTSGAQALGVAQVMCAVLEATLDWTLEGLAAGSAPHL